MKERHSKYHGGFNKNKHHSDYSKKENRRSDNHQGHRERHDERLFKANKFKPYHPVSQEQIAAEDSAIQSFKAANQFVCEKCGRNLVDMASAVEDRVTKKLIHFDCAIEELNKTESLAAGDKVVYIGQGRFGVLNFPNVHDLRHFTIKKIIEWDDKENKSQWRNDMAELYSQVK